MVTRGLAAVLMTVALVSTGVQQSFAADHRSAIGGPLLASRGLIVPTGVKAPPHTEAKAYVIADADTGQVLAAKDPHGHYLPASTLKALTALTLIPKLDKNRRIRPSQNACNTEGSAVGLTPKTTYSVEDLFRGLLMVSGNDAAVALAETNGGMATTLADMNAEAQKLQAFDTVAKTPNGLDKKGQSSSAYDLALIARAGLALPDFRKYVSTKTAKFPAPKGKTYEIGNHNKLLWRYDGMIGVKNGWTSKAFGSFIGAATRDGHTIIVTIMRHDGAFWDDVSRMLDWGFSVRGTATPVGTLVAPGAVAPSVQPSTLTLAPASPAASAPAAAGIGTDISTAPGLAATLVLGTGMVGGLAWIGYGLRRRRRRHL